MSLRRNPRRTAQVVAFIIARDGGDRCYRCGQPGARSLEHKIPLSRGGTDDPANLAVSHLACNVAAAGGLGERPRPRRAPPASRLASVPRFALSEPELLSAYGTSAPDPEPELPPHEPPLPHPEDPIR